MRARGEVTDADWALLEPVLRFPRRADGRGRPPVDTRAVLNGVLWILRTGAQWRELPKVNGGEDYLERLAKPPKQFVLPLDGQRRRAEDQHSLNRLA